MGSGAAAGLDMAASSRRAGAWSTRTTGGVYAAIIAAGPEATAYDARNDLASSRVHRAISLACPPGLRRDARRRLPRLRRRHDAVQFAEAVRATARLGGDRGG